MKSAIQISKFLRENPDGKLVTSTHSVGDGLWSIELHGLLWLEEDQRSVRDFLGEFVGPNGTHEEGADLHSQVEAAIKAAEAYNKAFHGGGYVAK